MSGYHTQTIFFEQLTTVQIYNYKLYVADEFFIVKMPCHNEYEKSPLMHKYVEILNIIQLQDCLEPNGLYKIVELSRFVIPF